MASASRPSFPFHLLALTACGLASTLTSQDPERKPAPAPRILEVDPKLGPTEPWVRPVERTRAARHGISGKPHPTRVRAGLAVDPFASPETLLWDVPAPGEVWVAAAAYKARFAHGSATYVPFLGSDAPCNRPVTFALRRTVVDGQSLPLTGTPTPLHRGDRVVFDHGSVLVRYDAIARGLEQSFELVALPARGELVLELSVATDLAVQSAGGDVRFAAVEGAVTYGEATAIDALGQRLAVRRTWHQGAITLTVPADFVRRAVLPLVVDPLVGTVGSVTSNSRTLKDADVTYDMTSGRYMVSCELVFSGTDSDAYTYELDGTTGQVVAGSQAIVDVTSAESWQAPRIANNNIADRNLVVAQVSSGNVAPFSIRGRTRAAGSTSTGNPVTLSSASTGNTGDKIRPDVAGDPHLFGPTYFTVTWERVYSSVDHDIHARQFTAAVDPVAVGPSEILVQNSSAYEEMPQISSSMGAPFPDALSQKAMVVYKRRGTRGSEVRGRLLRWDGNPDADFLVASGDALIAYPSVSTVTRANAQRERLYLVAWEQGYLLDGGDTNDIKIVLCDQTSAPVSPVTNLHTLERGSHIGWDQYRPRVASDGCRFVVAYGEDFNDSGDLDVRATTLHALPAGSTWTLGVTENRVEVAYRTTVETGGAVCSRFEAHDPDASGSARYCFAWSDANGALNNEIRCQLYDGVIAGGFTTLTTGCGGINITASGRPGLGEHIRVAALANVLLIGAINPAWNIPICGGATCRLGVIDFVQAPPAINLDVPCSAVLLGGRIGFQGVAVGSGSCFGGVLVTDTVVAQIQ